MAKVVIREGGKAAPSRRKFLVTKRDKPDLEVKFPPLCPHCLGDTTKQVSIGRTMKTGIVGSGHQSIIYRVDCCRRLLYPFVYYIGILIAGVIAVMAGIVAAVWHIGDQDGVISAVIVCAVLVAIIYFLWRQYSSIRFVYWGEGEVVFRVRRRAYAEALAELNDGEVT